MAVTNCQTKISLIKERFISDYSLRSCIASWGRGAETETSSGVLHDILRKEAECEPKAELGYKTSWSTFCDPLPLAGLHLHLLRRLVQQSSQTLSPPRNQVFQDTGHGDYGLKTHTHTPNKPQLKTSCSHASLFTRPWRSSLWKYHGTVGSPGRRTGAAQETPSVSIAWQRGWAQEWH